MGKILKLDFISFEDDWGCNNSQEIDGITDQGTEINFRVHDLCECPEDAIIGRDLFSGYDFIKALELGIQLAQEGYTKLDINYIEEE